MLENFDIQALVELAAWIGTLIYVVAQMKSDTRRNKESIEDLKKLIEKNNQETRNMFQSYKENQKESLSREIAHLKDLIELNAREQREDIKRLQSAQAESNRVKERLAIAEASLKSLHKRLDVEPPVFTNKEI